MAEYAYELFKDNHFSRPVHSGIVWCMAPCRSLQGDCRYLVPEKIPGSKYRTSLYCGEETGNCYNRQCDKWQGMGASLDSFKQRTRRSKCQNS